MNEHEAIEEIKDTLQIYEAVDPDEVETEFYNNLTLDEILDNMKEFNSLIGELKQILRRIK